MPLYGGNSQKIISSNIHEMLRSRTFAEGKKKKKRQEMAVAAALNKSREKK
jgi:hypothetical protein